MTAKIVGLFLDQQSLELARYHAGARNPIALYRKTVWYKARPRNREYMHELFRLKYPDGRFICIDQSADWVVAVSDADVVVLLYADAIGLGYSYLERQLHARTQPWTAVRVLNGRQRDFVLNRGTLWSLRMRRLIERAMLGEGVFLLLFVFVTPFLLLKDLFGERREQ
jgi:hypothetical protein